MDYYRLFRPLLFQLPPETAHHLAIALLRKGLCPAPAVPELPLLQTTLWGKTFANPLGLAAGFDKNAEALRSLLAMGFGFVEVGTVTPRPQLGNPKPRLFRLTEDEAIINRLGFNNRGMRHFTRKLARRPAEGIVGANIGKNKITEDPVADYLILLEECYGLSDYITINISSPNTPGLRDLQRKKTLNILLKAVTKKRAELEKLYQGLKVPLLLKMAPDVTEAQAEDIAELALEYGLEGLIISNTTLERPVLESRYAGENGGLSGRPLFARSTELLAQMYRLTRGKIPLVGVGGISSAEDAYAKIQNGASLVQLYTALIYQGMGCIPRMLEELAALLQKDGFKSVQEAVGVAVQKPKIKSQKLGTKKRKRKKA